MQINDGQVKWTKELVGKKVYLCTIKPRTEFLDLPESQWTYHPITLRQSTYPKPLLCEAEVVSIVGKRVLVKPVNFCILRGSSKHEVSSKEVWFTSPRAAVLARLKALTECKAKLIRERRLKEEYDFIRYGWVMSDYEHLLELAQIAGRFKSCPCDFQYMELLYIFKRNSAYGYKVSELAPNVEFTVDKGRFSQIAKLVKGGYGESVAGCFQKTNDGKYKVTVMSVYRFLKSKRRLMVPIIRKKWLSSVVTENTVDLKAWS